MTGTLSQEALDAVVESESTGNVVKLVTYMGLNMRILGILY